MAKHPSAWPTGIAATGETPMVVHVISGPEPESQRSSNPPGDSRASIFQPTSDDVVLSQSNQRNATILAEPN